TGAVLEMLAGGPLAGALKALVQALLERDPGARPSSAREALKLLGLAPAEGAPGARGAATGFAAPRRPAASASRRLIGREPELRELRNAVARLLAGQGDVVFVRADAGVGKTRLLDEVARHAAVLGASVIEGGAPDPAGSPLAT